MSRHLLLLIVSLCFLVLPRNTAAQGNSAPLAHPERGMALTEYFATGNMYEEINYCLSMDSKGILYISNDLGLLRFDGTLRPVIPSPRDERIYSMAMTPTDTLYFGSIYSFGRVLIDEKGEPSYDFLCDSLDENAVGFQYVWNTHVLDGKVWWHTDTALFCWDGRRMSTVLSPRGILLHSHIVRGDMYVLVDSLGLCRLQDHSLVLIPGGEYFGQSRDAIRWMLELEDEEILLCTDFKGMLRYDGRRFHRVQKLNSILPDDIKPYHAVQLEDGSIAIGTDRRGIWIVDPAGNALDIVNQSTGLGNNSIRDIITDGHHNIWVAMDEGFARVHMPSSITRFDKRNDLEGLVMSMTRFKGDLYAATIQGVYRLVPGPAVRKGIQWDGARFELVENAPSRGNQLLNLGEELLLIDYSGIYRMTGGRTFTKISEQGGRLLFAPRHTEDTLLIGEENGMSLLVRKRQGWEHIKLDSITPGIVVWIVQDSLGHIWTALHKKGMLRLDPAAGLTRMDTTLFYEQDGLDIGFALVPFVIDDHVRVITDTNLCIFDEISQVFRRDSAFLEGFDTPLVSEPGMIFRDRFGAVWMRMFNTEEFGQVLPGEKQRYRFDYRRYASLSGENLHSFYHDGDGTMWFGASGIVFRYSPDDIEISQRPFATLLRHVSFDDVLLQLGPVEGTEQQPIRIPADVATVYFHFTSTYYHKRERTHYRIFLEGVDEDWKLILYDEDAWYENLPSGDYIIHAQAVNVEGQLGSHLKMYVHVAAPWYATWWAITLFIVVPLGLIIIARLWYKSRVLTVHKRELELQVQERTMEIQAQSREISQQAQDLERMDSIVRAVNRETRLPSVLEALLMHSLLFFPHADMSMFIRRKRPSGIYTVVSAAGRRAFEVKGLEFSLRDLLGPPEARMERMQDGVYLLSGLGERFSVILHNGDRQSMRCMAMAVEQGKILEGYLVLGSEGNEPFTPSDRRRMLRLKEHASSAVAKAGAIEALEDKNRELDDTNKRLIDTQQQLVTHEKLAALGELTAGIAHEIQNPLNFVTNFSDLSCELMGELEDDLRERVKELDPQLGKVIQTIRSNCQLIRQHGQRATTIVEAMIMHSHTGSGTRTRIILNDLVDEFAQLAYNGMRLQFPHFSLKLLRDYDEAVGEVEVLPQEFSRAIVNLCNNAWEAAIEHCVAEGNEACPTVTVRSTRRDGAIHVFIRDNGAGISEELRARMFEPFFTTKTNSRNAGLGLSMTYEIITKLHNGELAVHSEDGQFTEIEIILPQER